MTRFVRTEVRDDMRQLHQHRCLARVPMTRQRLNPRTTARAINADRPIAPPPPPDLLDADTATTSVIVTCAESERLASADDMAVIVTVAGEGTLAGAV